VIDVFSSHTHENCENSAKLHVGRGRSMECLRIYWLRRC